MLVFVLEYIPRLEFDGVSLCCDGPVCVCQDIGKVFGSDWLGAAGVSHSPPQLVYLLGGVRQTHDALVSICAVQGITINKLSLLILLQSRLTYYSSFTIKVHVIWSFKSFYYEVALREMCFPWQFLNLTPQTANREHNTNSKTQQVCVLDERN